MGSVILIPKTPIVPLYTHVVTVHVDSTYPCFHYMILENVGLHIQSTLVISKSKGLSEILRDIRTSTYQICRIEKKR